MARFKMTPQTPPQSPYSLNAKISQLQQQMAEERVLQDQRQLQLQQVVSDRLTRWPVILGAVAAGVMLRQISRAAQIPASAPIAATVTPTGDAVITSPENNPQASGTSATPTAPLPSFWSTLLSLPLLSQSIWWLLQQIWQSGLFRDVVRQKLLKSDQRHPPY